MAKTVVLIFLQFLFMKFDFAFAQSSQADAGSRAELFLKIEPDYNRLNGSFKLNNSTDSVFRLAKGLKVISVENSEGEIPFSVLSTADESYSGEYLIRYAPKELTINFSGQIKADDFPQTISNLSRIEPELVELSDHIDWYPRMTRGTPANYKLVIDLPGNFVCVTNCTKTDEIKTGQRIQTTWISESPKYNITLLAAPGLKKSELKEGRKTIELYFDKLPASYTDSMKTDLMKTWNFYENLYGVKGATNEVRIVYAPRTAGGYARAPLIVVSEKYALEQLSTPGGYARDFRLNAHEIAHYWSRASTSTPDDWMNEGLSEFSALLASAHFIGKAFYNLLVDEYQGMVANTQTTVSVLETTAGSWEREINRYYKPTLLLNDLRIKYGDELLTDFFHVLYQKFGEEKTATTDLFLDALRNVFGSDEADSFLKALSETNRTNESKTLNAVDLDSVIIGVWTGKLTQFGATSQFVMHVNIFDGQVVTTLDSPDQNAFDIPVSEFQFKNDSVFFRLGIASATYSGILDTSEYTIRGIWKQRNVSYPLDISKRKNGAVYK